MKPLGWSRKISNIWPNQSECGFGSVINSATSPKLKAGFHTNGI
jgi:hypothetical protein